MRKQCLRKHRILKETSVLRSVKADGMVEVWKAVKRMSITGYYDGTAVLVNEPLRMNQKVIVIPIENEESIEDTAEGGLRAYANPALINQEKDAWRKAAVRKYVQE